MPLKKKIPWGDFYQEIFQYNVLFFQAEQLYLEADMRSLAVRMRKRLGDWFKVVQLLKTGSGGNDAEMEEAYNEVRIPGLTKSL